MQCALECNEDTEGRRLQHLTGAASLSNLTNDPSATHLDLGIVDGDGPLVQDARVGKARLLRDAQEVVDVQGPSNALTPNHLQPKQTLCAHDAAILASP
jgi:hypothetical protein